MAKINVLKQMLPACLMLVVRTLAAQSGAVQLNPSGAQTVAQPMVSGSQTTLGANSLNGVLNATLFSGSDLGAQIDSAYSACASTGCTILIPPGAYLVSTPVVIATIGKPAIIQCSGTSTTITWMPATGTLFQFAANGANNGQGWGQGVRDCNLSSSQNAGSTAVEFGVTATDTTKRTAQGSYLENVQINGFGKQVDYESQAWNITLNHVELINAAGNAIWMNPDAVNSGENLNFIGVTVANSGVWAPQAVFLDAVTVIAHFIGSNFDNTQLSIPLVDCRRVNVTEPVNI